MTGRGVAPRPELRGRLLEDLVEVDLLPAGRGRELEPDDALELRVRAGEDARVAMVEL